ncbi:MAG: hypothetical protein AB7D39_11835 [Pseudodesulfovibrio sp.]|uniref:hypothetical protein n=1 Tax=Pseudodesulfovibrio sp. TaxID=2035812 RepID=UPI003D0DCF29
MVSTDKFVNKVNTILSKQAIIPLSEDDVSIVLVNLRIMMEQQRLEVNYPTLKFYCDWSLHDKKSRNIMKSLRVVSELVNTHFNETKGINRSLTRSLDTSILRNDIINICHIFSVNHLLDNDIKWSQFVINVLLLICERPIDAEYYKKNKTKKQKSAIRYISRGLPHGFAASLYLSKKCIDNEEEQICWNVTLISPGIITDETHTVTISEPLYITHL